MKSTQPTSKADKGAPWVKRKLPRSVIFIILLVLLLAGYHLTRLVQSLVKWQLLDALLPFSPLYLALNGLVWGVGGLILAWGWMRALPWAYGAARWTALLYSLNLWLERLLLAGSPERNANWPFIALVNAAALAWLFWQLERPVLKVYFRQQ